MALDFNRGNAVVRTTDGQVRTVDFDKTTAALTPQPGYSGADERAHADGIQMGIARNPHY